jgi:hypothetical protein
MADLNAVLKHVGDYCAARISLDAFEDRFRDDSRGAYLVPEFDDLCVSIESALSDYHFGEGMDELLLRQELAKAVHPFRLEVIEMFFGKPPYTTMSASVPIPLKFAVA